MERIRRHFIVCLITGFVTVLPIGGTILLIVYAEKSLSPLIPAQFYVPGEGLLLVIVLLYLLGLTLTSVIGRWLRDALDSALSSIPGIGTIFRTLKQILGFDAGEGALFQKVVLVQNESVGSTEIGLVTAAEGGKAAQNNSSFSSPARPIRPKAVLFESPPAASSPPPGPSTKRSSPSARYSSVFLESEMCDCELRADGYSLIPVKSRMNR